MVTFLGVIFKCSASLIVLLLSGAALFFFGKYFFTIEDNTVYLDVNSKEILFEVDEKFLSVALDVSFMRCFVHKFTDRDWIKLEKLSSLLSPGYLRFGGNDADRAVFDFNSISHKKQISENVSCQNNFSESGLTITGEEWIKLNKFAQKSGLSLIVDLNDLIRRGTQWDSSNAEALIKFSEQRGFPLDFQLGNEPNSFPHVFNVTITGNQLAKDFHHLKRILNSTDLYKRSKLIGPDVTRPKGVGIPGEKFLEKFLEEVVVDVVSWHQYYLNGRTATLKDFINPKTFDLLSEQIEIILETVRRHTQSTPIWLSETSSAYGGGAPNLSDRFVASFLWLDKLGLAARTNTSVVIRQSLFKDHYALITNEFTPTPDFWISVLFKNLIGRQVFGLKVSDQSKSEFLRFYCHCLASNVSLNGSVVIYGMNLGNETELLIPSGFTIDYPIYAYIFKPESNDLTAKEVLLNNIKLEYNETLGEDLVKMGHEVELPLIIPPLSIGFWVLNENSVTLCQR